MGHAVFFPTCQTFPDFLDNSRGGSVRRYAKGRAALNDESSYICDSCGEEIVVPIDLSAGADQEYVEDCPVCCCPNVVHVQVDEDGDVRVWATRE
jgi:hypothetical protein